MYLSRGDRCLPLRLNPWVAHAEVLQSFLISLASPRRLRLPLRLNPEGVVFRGLTGPLPGPIAKQY